MNTNTPLKPLISLPPNQCNEINGLWEHHKMKKGLFYVKKLLSNSYSESDSMKPDEYWEAVFQDEGNYPEKSDCECDSGEILEPCPISALDLIGQAMNLIVQIEGMEGKEKLLYEHIDMLSSAFALLCEVEEYLYSK